MGDEEQRRLDRTGESVEDLARQLRLRLRAGELSFDVVEFCAFLGHAPAQRVLDGPVPVGEFVPWDRWAAALSFEFWVLTLRFRCDRDLAELHDDPDPERAESLRALRSWLEAPTESPPASRFGGLHTWARGLWRWHVGEGYLRRKSLLRVDGPNAPGFHPRQVAGEAVPLLTGQAFSVSSALPSEVDYLLDKLERGSLSRSDLKRAAEAGHDPAREAVGSEALALGPWLRSLLPSPPAFHRATRALLVPVAGALLSRRPQQRLWPVRELTYGLLGGAVEGRPESRRRLQEARVRLLEAQEALPRQSILPGQGFLDALWTFRERFTTRTTRSWCGRSGPVSRACGHQPLRGRRSRRARR